MTSATLYREGLDLDGLLAELDAESPGRVRVVDVDYGRAGGVLGFFARRTVGVHYVLNDADADSSEESALDELVSAADAADAAEVAAQIVESGRAPDAAPGSDNVEFAR